MKDYLALIGTAFNKQPRQLIGIANRAVKSAVLPRLPVDLDTWYEDRIPEDVSPHIEPIRENTLRLRESIEKPDSSEIQESAAVEGKITFLNKTVSFNDGAAVSMDADSVLKQSLHWQLKCWGFEHLKPAWQTSLDPTKVSDDTIRVHRSWLEDWMGDHPIAADTRYLRRYWMPHSVCLRILNWSRYDSLFAERLDGEFRENIRHLVYKNSAFLSDNIEYGVGGNHLIENAVALVVAGTYLENEDWLEQGRRILRQAAKEQFFDDGGHFERSPMYHLIVSQRYITSADLLGWTDKSNDIIASSAVNAVKFIEGIRPPDGKIPLLNDSVFCEALNIDELRRYSQACNLTNTSMREPGRSDHTDTGYYWLGNAEDCLLAVGGKLAVKHLPGHAHAHPAQVLLWIDGRRVLTDTGVLEYAAGDARQHAKSVRSHNTVQVDGAEPVRFGDSFFWFGNVNPTVEKTGDSLKISYGIDRIGSTAYDHSRTIKYDADGWKLTDQITGIKSKASARFHIHPDLRTTADDSDVSIIVDDTGQRLVNFRLLSEGNLSIETAPYYPKYGMSRTRNVIVVTRGDNGRFEMRIDVL